MMASPAPELPAVERIVNKLRLETPLTAVYDSEPSDDFAPLVSAKGRTCCFAYYDRWLKGETLAIRKTEKGFHEAEFGCHGAQVSFGLSKDYPDFMAHFLTDGVGAPMGEGLKATPEISQEFIDNARRVDLSSDHVLIGPLRTEKWDHVRSVTFFVDPDRLSGVMTLAGYWSSDPRLILAPFSSGCGLMLRELEGLKRDHVIIGATDMAMRKYLPPEILALTVSPKRFALMTTVPDGSFLDKEWWNELMNSRVQ
jgi:hypothetical protein